MNKKVITLIGVLVLLVVIGGVIYFTTRDNTQSNENPNQENNNQVTNDNEENNNEEECEDNNTTSTGNRVLILYFSMSGNTETVAEFIHEEVGGDLVKLETEKTYSSDYNDLLDEAQEEQRNNARPALKTTINLDNYDVIFLGYPNWWGDMPMPIYTLLDEYDFSGKIIAPFVTSGGSGFSNTLSEIRNAEPNANVTEGLSISGSSASSSRNRVNTWVEELGY